MTLVAVVMMMAFEVACIGLVLTVAVEEEGRSHSAKRRRGGQIVDGTEGDEMTAVVEILGPDIGRRNLWSDILLMEI